MYLPLSLILRVTVKLLSSNFFSLEKSYIFYQIESLYRGQNKCYLNSMICHCIVRVGENAGCQRFLFFSQCFQKASLLRSLEHAWMKVFRIIPDFRISACQKVHFFFIFPIKSPKFAGFQDFQ